MKILSLLLLTMVLLTVEGALGKVLHLQLLRPDLVLIVVIWVAFHDLPGAPAIVFGVGMLADSFAGTPTGMLTLTYLLCWCLTRAAQAFLLPDRILVQISMLFAMSVLTSIVLAVSLHLVSHGGSPVVALLTWAIPVALINVLLAGPIWALIRRIMGRMSHPGSAQTV